MTIDNPNEGKRIRSITVLFIVSVVLFLVIVTPLLYAYFTEPVLYVNNQQFKQTDEINAGYDNVVHYSSSSGFTIDVRRTEDRMIVLIEQQEYVIEEKAPHMYQVNYPGGQQYEVIEDNGRLTSYTEESELVSPLSIYVDDKKLQGEGEGYYHPISLVRSAYPEYHTTRGIPALCILSFVILVYGWYGFRYEKFQNFIFLISPYRLYVKDAEPSDFYYFMCKVGGVISMGLAVVLFFMSL